MKTTTVTSPFLVGTANSDVSAAAGFLTQEYQKQAELFSAQPVVRQRYLETQAGVLSKAILEKTKSAAFSLPDKISLLDEGEPLVIPAEMREQNRIWNKMFKTGTFSDALRQRLDTLEAHYNPGVSTAAGLLRFCVARYLV